MSRPAIITDAEHAAHFVAEAMLEVMQATDGQRAAAELAEYLTEAFRDVQDLEGVADAVASEMLPWLRPALFPPDAFDVRPRILYQHPDGLGTIKADAARSRLVVINEVSETAAAVTIGPDGLRSLAAELVKLAGDLEGLGVR